MIKIDEIIKTKGDRYLLKILNNGVIETHFLSENTIIKYGFLTPRELSEKEYQLVVKDKTSNLLYEKALKYIDYQMRTISEVKKYLKKEIIDDSVIDKIIKKLKENGYLNDDLYVKTYLTEKLEFDLVGPMYIKQKLILKGIHYDIIDSNLINYNDDIQFDKILELIKKETKYPIKKAYKKAYLSLKQKLVNKGFSISIIESSLMSNHDIIDDAIAEDDLLKREVELLKKKYDLSDYTEKDKAIKSLLSKGFNYDKIKLYLKG